MIYQSLIGMLSENGGRTRLFSPAINYFVYLRWGYNYGIVSGPLQYLVLEDPEPQPGKQSTGVDPWAN